MNRERRLKGRAIRKARRQMAGVDWPAISIKISVNVDRFVAAMNEFAQTVSAVSRRFEEFYLTAFAEARTYRLTYRALPEKPSPWAAPIQDGSTV